MLSWNNGNEGTCWFPMFQFGHRQKGLRIKCSPTIRHPCKCYLGFEELKRTVSILYAHFHSRTKKILYHSCWKHFYTYCCSLLRTAQFGYCLPQTVRLMEQHQRSSAALGFIRVNYPLRKPSQHSLKCFQNILTKGELPTMPRKQHWKQPGIDLTKSSSQPLAPVKLNFNHKGFPHRKAEVGKHKEPPYI